MAQLVECLPSILKVLSLIPALQKPDLVAQAYNANTWLGGGSKRVRSIKPSSAHSEFENSLNTSDFVSKEK